MRSSVKLIASETYHFPTSITRGTTNELQRFHTLPLHATLKIFEMFVVDVEPIRNRTLSVMFAIMLCSGAMNFGIRIPWQPALAPKDLRSTHCARPIALYVLISTL